MVILPPFYKHLQDPPVFVLRIKEPSCDLRESKSWVLTGYTIDNNTDAKGRGSDLSYATQNDTIRTRAELGAALKSAANIRRIFGTASENTKKDSENDDEGLRVIALLHPFYQFSWKRNTLCFTPFT